MSSTAVGAWRTIVRELFSSERRLIFTIISLGIIQACATLSQPWLTGNLVGALGNGGNIKSSFGLVCFVFIIDALVLTLYSFLIGTLAQRFIYRLRVSAVEKITQSRMNHFTDLDNGDVHAKAVGDSSIVSIVISQSATQLVTSSLLVFGGVTCLIFIDRFMAVVALGALLLAGLVSLYLSRQIRVASIINRKNISAFGEQLHRILSGFTTIKAAAQEKNEIKASARVANAAKRSGIKVTMFGALLQPTMNVGTQAALALVIVVGVMRVSSGILSIADVTAFLMYLFYLIAPLVNMFSAVGQLQQGRASLERVATLINLPQENVVDQRGHLEANSRVFARPHTANETFSYEQPVPAVRFENVSFSYDGIYYILKNINFKVPSKGITAIVGPSGSGKSTIFKLIERFYEISSGRIMLDGKDITQLPLDDLRKSIGYADQDSSLIVGTVKENLLYGSSEMPDAEIYAVLELFDLADTVSSLPRQLEQNLDDTGWGLSGGERQRLVLARCVLNDPKVLLLDEVTAHLDSKTEASIVSAVRELSRTRAVIVISHQEFLIESADHIIALDDV